MEVRMMKTQTRLGVMLLALLMSSIIFATPAFAAEPQVSVNTAGESVYTKTIDMQLQAMPYASESSKTVTANKSLGLALDPGRSGWSVPVTFRYSLPSNAVVRSIEIDPGRGIINNNNKNMMGTILISKIEVTSPLGKMADIGWKASGMKDTTHFLQQPANGNWTARIYGTNISRPTGDPILDIRFFGSISYKSAKMTISYILE